ncbi:MAG: hypothetical protein Q8O83_03605 [bacterium]|nr:hypothetical protein [bacterium]
MEYRKKTKRGFNLGPNSQKVLILLLGGALLGLNHNPKKYFNIVRGVAHWWKEVDQKALHRAIKSLYNSRLIKTVRNKDGTYTLVLTQKGEEKALRYKIDAIRVAPMEKWDGKWRIVLFDIPEKSRVIRDALRRALIRAGFFEYQKSVFVHPFECQDEVDFVIEFFYARPYTRFIIADSLDNEFHLKKYFKLG